MILTPCQRNHNKINMDKKTALMILGLDEGASFETAKKAFRTLAKQHHPDLVRDVPLLEKESGSRMKEINLAFCYLAPLLKVKKTTKEPEQKSIKKNRSFSIFARVSRWALRRFDQKKASKPAKKNMAEKVKTPGTSKQKPLRFEQVFKTVHPGRFVPGQKKSPRKKVSFKHRNPYSRYQTYMALKKKIQMGRTGRPRDISIGKIEKIEAVRPVGPVRGR